MSLPTKSNSEYPNLHLDAFKNKLCNLNRSKIERKCDQYTSHIYGILGLHHFLKISWCLLQPKW